MSAGESETVCSLFIEGSHHLNISVFYLTQNAFHKSKYNRCIHLSAGYLILFKNPRNHLQPAILARDIFPNHWREFMKLYDEATSRPYGYVLLDFKQDTPDNERVVTDILQSAPGAVEAPASDMMKQSEQSLVPWVSLEKKSDMEGGSIRSSLANTYKKLLTLLSDLPLQQVKGVISNMNANQVKALKEVMRNILAGNVKLSSEQKKLLRPHKNFIINFAHSSMERCKLNRHCRAILLALQAAKSTIEQL